MNNFKQKTAFLNMLERIRKLPKKHFDNLMYGAWMDIWRSENSEEAFDIFSKNFMEDLG